MQSSSRESAPHNESSQNVPSYATGCLSDLDTRQDASVNTINNLEQSNSPQFDLPVQPSDGDEPAPTTDDLEMLPCISSHPFPRARSPSQLPNPFITLDHLLKARAQHPDSSHPLCHPLHSQPVQYQINQEVHLLDSDGTERTGVTTYKIISSTSSVLKAQDPTTSNLSLSQLQQSDLSQERIYTLIPVTHTKFTTTTPHILPVGYSLGAEVKQYTNPIPALVIRRTVQKGQRLYDLKDQAGDVQYDVNEAEIRPWSGGQFGFREVRE